MADLSQAKKDLINQIENCIGQSLQDWQRLYLDDKLTGFALAVSSEALDLTLSDHLIVLSTDTTYNGAYQSSMLLNGMQLNQDAIKESIPQKLNRMAQKLGGR